MPLDLIKLEGAPKGPPPSELWPFIWHFVRQIKGLLLVLLTLEACVAAGQAMIPVMIGWLVNDINAASATRDVLDHPWLWQVAAPILVAWGGFMIVLWFIYDHIYTPRFNNLIRYQLARYTLGHSMAYFAHDFAGRIANKVVEGGAALRDPLRSVMSAMWYCGFFSVAVVGTMMHFDLWLATPVVVWLTAYIASLFYFLPRARKLQLAHNRDHTRLVGHINDVYANIGLVKLFAREAEETAATLAELEAHGASFGRALDRIWRMGATHSAMNVALLISAPTLALAHWQEGRISSGVAVMVIPMVWQLVNMSGWIRHESTAVFEALARVEECMETIAQPWSVVDRPDAGDLQVKPGGGTIAFKNISFDYGGEKVVEGLALVIPAGQKVGLIGRSGAGKSTLVNLLLRFYDLKSGKILIDGQDIAAVTQRSLRSHIAVVTQDNSLLHRTIAENIAYGRPEASCDELREAARRAHAEPFIESLSDQDGARGFAAQVGERGVKLSGGQRQRIAIARVILEDAPILVLDEATSALDSEVEAAIQQEMTELMRGRTTLAIAHRLSTIAHLDRLIVLDKGRIVEDGSHAELLARDGLYAQLWRRQSGGFLGG
ncbi:ATP-binding cassette, subfamily B, multidrug efflux pump [Rhodoblastus acidophilus]|uniref:ATP-binding cassette, subfamily B, multidrug efflux pump n=1 Tax=Rhodoblastus acidophilus TaxID=1074 RepID=A0A212RA40_RHOAC|nr:ABC transporter ATP-binding protein [Rhodoblastus acidophilus]PPQ39293.1 ABC transporter ATP-binding protein [Rhodoblastus acidophilus]RAI22366.1 ABC transporter ATP-binding protein [Rhodoblastus acidophilus]SNB68875.1 ATP-binding cassette, subfamily B, multidrug efflux pump [Rhodoblastus acidophilus]